MPLLLLYRPSQEMRYRWPAAATLQAVGVQHVSLVQKPNACASCLDKVEDVHTVALAQLICRAAIGR